MEAISSFHSSTSFRLSPLRLNPSNPISLSHLLPIRSPLLSSIPKRHSPISSSISPPAAVPAADPAALPDAGAGEGTFDWLASWYPLAPICDLDKRAPLARTVMGLDVVVWWDRASNQWRAFDDRCPHRLAPLSEGRIDGRGRLQCVYHGWCFDGAGRCKYIPQAPPDGPPVHTSEKACVAVYPTFEQNKILWFWPNTDPQYKDISAKERPPYFQELDDPSYTCTMGMRDVPYGYEILIENLMDPAHVPYAHHGILRIPKHPPLPGRAETDREGGIPLEITIESLDMTGFIANQQWVGISKFVAPCAFYAPLNVAPTNSSGIDQEESSATTRTKKRRSVFIFLCIPVSPGRSRVIWVFPRNFGVWVDQLVPRWMFHVGDNLVIDSDLYLLHLEERKIAEAGPSNWQKACYVPTKSDAQVIAFRKWLRKYSQNRVDWGTKFSGFLPPTPKEQLMDRYWSHVVNCRSCGAALKGLKALEFLLQVISLVTIAAFATLKGSIVPSGTRSIVVSVAVLCFLASRWLSRFIHKNFYFHDYNHAFR